MVDICPKCGMPQDICACEDIARESQKIKIMVEKRLGIARLEEIEMEEKK